LFPAVKVSKGSQSRKRQYTQALPMHVTEKYDTVPKEKFTAEFGQPFWLDAQLGVENMD